MENVAALTEWALNHLTNLRRFFESEDLERAQFYIAEVNVPSFDWKNRNANFGEKRTDRMSLPLLSLSLPAEIFKTKRPLVTKKDGSCLFNSIFCFDGHGRLCDILPLIIRNVHDLKL